MNKYFWAILPIVLIVGAVVAGILIYRAGVVEVALEQSSPTSAPVETFSPTPTPALKREEVKLQVLNGAGVPGSATKAKAILEGLGYKDVAMGNADSFDFETTLVQAKESKKDYAELLVSDLSGEYEVEVAAEPLEESNDYDVVITLGAK